MSRDARKDLSSSPETVQLLSGHVRGDTPYARPEPAARWPVSTDVTYPQGAVSSSGPMSQDNESTRLIRENAQIGEFSRDPTAAIVTPRSIIVNGVENDDPPPYSAIPPPYSVIAPRNHVGWPYGLFSYDITYPTDTPSYRVEIPLASLQASPTSAVTGFHPERTNGQHASLPMTYGFFKFGCRRSSLASREMSLPGDGIVEKINDRKSRRYGAILVAAAVIIFLMALSLMVRFVMEKSWWRR